MVTILLSLVAFAQPPQPPRFNPAKFEADMEQFITTEAGLTPMEASRFFLCSGRCRTSSVRCSAR